MRFSIKQHSVILSNLKLLLFFGKPGSGKTYISRKLAFETGFRRISTDETRELFFLKPSFNDCENIVLWNFLYKQIFEAIKKGNGVIVDGNIGRIIYRNKLVKKCESTIERPIYSVSILVECSDELALKRLRKRSLKMNPFGCTKSCFEKIKNDIEICKSENLITFLNDAEHETLFKESFYYFIHSLEELDEKICKS